MLKAFCDVCETECDPQRSATRRAEKIKGSLGLEVIPIFNGGVEASRHVCDNCIASALIESGLRYTKAPRTVEIRQAVLDAGELRRLQTEVTNRSEQLGADLRSINQLITEAKAAIEEVKTLPIAEAEKVKVLQATVESLERRVKDKDRLDENIQRQSEEDARNYPEYIQRVQRRERIRAS